MNEKQLYERLGRNISERRKAIRATQANIAQKVDISRASLANIERGNQKVLLHHLYRLASALELEDVSELIPIGTLEGSSVKPEIKAQIASPEGLTKEQLAQIEAMFLRSVANTKIGVR